MILDQFSLRGKTALVAGGEGLLGKALCKTIKELDGHALSVDIQHGADIICDLTVFASVLSLSHLPIDILINCAVGNQKPGYSFSLNWEQDLALGLTASLYTIECLGDQLRKRNGIILNIGSDLSLIAPDNSLYPPRMVKPLSYSVVKHGIIGLTRYFAALWPNVRCNCLCPGGIEQGQKVPRNIIGRNARIEEITAPAAFLISEASSFMTGSVMVVDGGRTTL